MITAGAMLTACSSDKEDEEYPTSSERTNKVDANEIVNYADICFSGRIALIEHEELGKYVFIGELISPEEIDNFYIKTIVVPKDEFPLQKYKNGDIITFNIIEIKYSFPLIHPALYTYPSPSQFLCSIKLCSK